MVTKLKHGSEELDIPRGINLPHIGDSVSLKLKNKTTEYTVVDIVHKLDYDVSIKTGNTMIILEPTSKAPKKKEKVKEES